MEWEDPITTWGQAGKTVPGAGDFNRIEGNTQYLKDEVDSHLADFTLQVPFGGTTTNSGNNYSIASPAISSLTAGMAIAVKINADSTGACTLNWNGKGAKPIKKANGTDVTNLKAGGIYTLRYDGTNFILQGEGASGNATASDLLSGKTATTDAGEIVGTIPLKGAQTYTPGTTNQVISAGQYLSGAQTIKGDANLVASNIRSGKSIFGVNGSLTPASFASGIAEREYYGDSRVIKVEGLTFKPDYIFTFPSQPATDASFNVAIYCVNIDTPYIYMYRYVDSGSVTMGALPSGSYVNSTGFRLPSPYNSSAYWYAFKI